jgi:hypothetical protein
MSVGIYEETSVEIFRQALRVSDPDTGLALAGCLIVAQFAVQFFNYLDSVSQRSVYRVGGFSVEIPKLIQALDPMALVTHITKVTPIIRCVELAVVWAVSLFYYFLNQ